jgi:hypothetical protein
MNSSGLYREYCRRAFEKDSTFYAAALWEMSWTALRKNPRTDTLIALLDPHYEKMTVYEQTLFKANKASFQRDWGNFGRFLGEIHERFPRDPFITRTYGFTLAFRENRPAKAWEVVNKLPTEQLKKPGIVYAIIMRPRYALNWGIKNGPWIFCISHL